MKTSILSSRRWWCIAILSCRCLSASVCGAYHASPHSSSTLLGSRTSKSILSPHPSSLFAARQQPFQPFSNWCNNRRTRRAAYPSLLRVSTIDIDVPIEDTDDATNNHQSKSYPDADNILLLKDILPISIYTTFCFTMAIMVSTYEDFDVTHTRPNPGTLRLPTTTITTNNGNRLNFLGAATKGMGWGPSNRGDDFFEDWYGSSATTLQWKPSYNEIMLQHRKERVPRWTELNNNERDDRSVKMFGASLPSSASSQGTNIGFVTETSPTSATTTKEQLQQAVLQLYNSLNELDELKLMADDYMWDEMKELMKPTSNIIITMGSTSSTTTTSSAEDAAAVGRTSGRNNNEYSLPKALEYSMDVLKTMPTYYASATSSTTTTTTLSSSNTVDSSSSNYMKEIPEIIGFDWGSCAWRHCGAKADAQEAIAELYNSVGMLEPFECRFIIDIVERSIRDVLTIVPDDLKPHENGIMIQPKVYEPYVPKAGDDEDGLGIDYEYVQALQIMREDMSQVEDE